MAAVAALALVFALSLPAGQALAQGDDGANVANSPAEQASENASAASDDAQASASAADTADTASDSVSENAADPSSTGKVETPTDQYRASIVVGENQEREYDGSALRDDEYCVEVTYDGNGKVVRYHAQDKGDVDFAFFTEDGDSLEGPPVNAGAYKIQAQIITTKDHAGRLLEDSFQITRKIVSLPTAATDLTYNGEEQTGVAESDQYIVEGGSATEAGSYTARLTLRDPQNFTFETGDVLTSRNAGFIEIAWAIASPGEESSRADYNWEVTPVDDPDLTFGNMSAHLAPSRLMADIMTVRDNCIDRLSSVVLRLYKFTRALFPNLSV